jgi:hypothetical protein
LAAFDLLASATLVRGRSRITRLYDARRRRYVQIVILTEEAWHDLNGAVTAAALETAADFFPEPVQIVFEGQRFVIVTFDLWKEREKRRQQQEI